MLELRCFDLRIVFRISFHRVVERIKNDHLRRSPGRRNDSSRLFALYVHSSRMNAINAERTVRYHFVFI